MKESSDPQFFRTTTGIQSGPDAFDKSRFIMTFLTLLGNEKYYVVSDQFQRGKQVKRYLSHQDQGSQKSFQHLQAVEQRRYNRFTFVEHTISNSPRVQRARFQGKDGLFCFISICKFGSLKNRLQRLLACLKFTLDLVERFGRRFGTNEKSDLYELWQQHKQLKTMEISQA